MLLGAHVSTAGGMRNAVPRGKDLGCEAIQVFTRNQRQWTGKPLDPADAAAFRAAAAEAGYLATALSHASYLINLAAPDPAILEKSIDAFVDEIERCAALGIPYLAVHPGSHMGRGEEHGIACAARSVKTALAATRGKRVMVLLEVTAGQGTNLGHRLEHLRAMLDAIDSERVAVCLDTCHMHAAGYDLVTPKGYAATFEEVDRLVGLDRVKAFHLNDSKGARGQRIDRHEEIGDGTLGTAPFERLVRDARFRDLPGILETPGAEATYARNLALLQRLRGRG
jgi:deoxyribonuclease-4